MSKHSGCCSHDDDQQEERESHSHKHDREDNHDHEHAHEHSHSEGGFDLRAELAPVGLVIALFAVGIGFEEALHNTPFAIAEYAIFIAAYLLAGWNVLKIAGRNIVASNLLLDRASSRVRNC